MVLCIYNMYASALLVRPSVSLWPMRWLIVAPQASDFWTMAGIEHDQRLASLVLMRRSLPSMRLEQAAVLLRLRNAPYPRF